MPSNEMIRARVPEQLKTAFESAAEKRGLSSSHVLRELMTGFVAREEELEQRRVETLEALEDFAAGRVVEGEKVFEWLESWGTDRESDPPK